MIKDYYCPDVDKGAFGKRLREVMKEQGVSYRDLERYNVCSTSMVRNYARGIHTPNAETLARMSAFLDVSCDWLIGVSDIKDLPPRWVFVDGECRCSKCMNRGETTFLYCPSCRERMARQK